MTPVKAVLFDFDYTLGDATDAIVECVNFALDRFGYAPATVEAVRNTIGLSLHEIFYRLAGPQSDDACSRFNTLFIEKADQVVAAGTRMYPQVQTVLQVLRRQSLRTGIVSAKFRYRIETILARAGLTSLFDVIVGGEDVDRHKPAPDALLLAIERLNLAANEALYIGDSLVDAEAAHRARVPFAAVTTGVTPPNDFMPLQPIAIFTSLTELPAFLFGNCQSPVVDHR